MNKGYWAGDAISTSMESNIALSRANRELEKAERFHGKSLAKLAAAMRVLEEIAPDHPLHYQAVQEVIGADGAVAQVKGFSACWELDHDPAAILLTLKEERAEAVAKLLPEVEGEEIKPARGGFLWLSKQFLWLGDRYRKLDEVEATRAHILHSLRSGDVDHPHDLQHLKKSAWEACGVGV